MLISARLIFPSIMLVALAACNTTQQTAATKATTNKVATTPLPAYARPLTNEQLTALMPGFKGLANGFATKIYQTNGTFVHRENGKSYTGNWSLKNDTVCTVFKGYKRGVPQCRLVIPGNAGNYLFKGVDGASSFTMKATG